MPQAGPPSALLVLTAEFLATLFLVFLGCGAIVSATREAAATTGVVETPSIVAIALGFGLAYASATYIFASLSGAILNPALTVALMVTRKIRIGQGIFYILAQVAGGIVGAAILDAVTGRDKIANLGATQLGSRMSDGDGFGMEFVLGFMYVLAVFSLGDTDNITTGSLKNSYVQIGLLTTVLVFVGTPFTGAGFNPARSFGPAVVAKTWGRHWLYWFGPIFGGVLAALFHSVFLHPGGSPNATAPATHVQPVPDSQKVAPEARASAAQLEGVVTGQVTL